MVLVLKSHEKETSQQPQSIDVGEAGCCHKSLEAEEVALKCL